MGYVLVCDAQPLYGDCPAEFANWVQVDSLQVSSEPILPTIEEFNSSLPWIILTLMMAWGFRLIVRQILNR